MSFLLDHLTAVVVGTILLGALVVLQIQSQETSIDAVQQHRASAQAAELAATLERELENVRSRAETEHAFALVPGGLGFGPDAYRFRLARATGPDGTEYTRQLTFPTLADPSAGPLSEVHVVTYEVTPTGETTAVDGRARPLYRATRHVFARGGPIRETATFERLVDFDVAVYGAGGAEVTETPELAALPVRVQVTLRHAPEGADAAASIRHVRTVRVVGVEGGTGAAVDEALAGGIPALPGDPGYDPAAPPVPTADWGGGP